MNITTLLYVVALILWAIAIFPVPSRYNLVAAGLTSAMLGFLLGSGVLHG